jgi:hypothetical protein
LALFDSPGLARNWGCGSLKAIWPAVVKACDDLEAPLLQILHQPWKQMTNKVILHFMVLIGALGSVEVQQSNHQIVLGL